MYFEWCFRGDVFLGEKVFREYLGDVGEERSGASDFGESEWGRKSDGNHHWVVAAIFCFKAIGLNLGALVTVGGVSGIAVGLASKQVLENALMGVLLYTTTPFIIGDTVKIPREGKELNYAEGQIIDIGLFRTAIKTLEREVILLPNSELGAMSIINVTRRGREFRFNERMTVRLKDANQLSKLLSSLRASDQKRS